MYKISFLQAFRKALTKRSRPVASRGNLEAALLPFAILR